MVDYFVPHHDMKLFHSARRTADRLELYFLVHWFAPNKPVSLLRLSCREACDNDVHGFRGLENRRADYGFDARGLTIRFHYDTVSQDLLAQRILAVSQVEEETMLAPSDAIASILEGAKKEFDQLLETHRRRDAASRARWEGLQTRIAWELSDMWRKIDHFKGHHDRVRELEREQEAYLKVAELMRSLQVSETLDACGE